ncbi:MAG: hypothetical protein J6I69_02375 [Bacilli bacterium]|nr:hypothetical protein [Bacilli bacterium]
MAKPYRLNNRVSMIDRNELKILNFLGLDRRTNKFDVYQSRAIDELNYIYKSGILVKREGYSELLNIQEENYYPISFEGSKSMDSKSNLEEGRKFNGLFYFKDDLEKGHLIAHVGKLLYVITRNVSTDEYSASLLCAEQVYDEYTQTNKKYCYEFLNKKSNAFVGDHRLWFLGGNQYMVLEYVNNKFTLQPVKNIAYIPTTTISITYKDSDHALRENLDDVNMLTPLRRNLLNSNTIDDVNTKTRTTRFYEYLLDSNISWKDVKNSEDITVRLRYSKE